MNEQIPENSSPLDPINPEPSGIPAEETTKNPAEETAENTPEETAVKPTVISTPSAPKKRMGKFVAIAGISLVSAIVGSLTTVAAIPYLYPNSGNTPISSTLGGTKPLLPVSNTGSASANFPVAEIAKAVGPAVVGVSNFQTSRGFAGNSGLQEAGSGSGLLLMQKRGTSSPITT